MKESKLKKVSLKIKNIHGDNLCTDLRFPETGGKEKFPLVIFCHGFKGFKDWGGFPYMMEKISEDGFFTVAFNYSYDGTGESESEQSEFSRLDLFAKNTFTRELDDTGSVIDYIFENENKYCYDTGNITLIGHSRGGGIAILKTAADRRIGKLIALAPVATFDRHSEALKKKWKLDGYIESLNTRTNQMMRMNYALLEDLENNFDKLNIQKAITEIKVPVLIIHGTEDLSVDYSNGEDLFSRSNKNLTHFELIEKTGHTFGAVHPFNGTTKAYEEVIKLIKNFLNNKKLNEN